MNGRKDQRLAQTILKGERRVVMLLKYGQESMKIYLETGRRVKNAAMEECLKCCMGLMSTEVKPEVVMCKAKLFFKTYSSFHLVTARDKAKETCSCPAYYQDTVCKHVALMDIICDTSFEIP